MPSSQYYDRQADTCIKLATVSAEEEVARRLITMAEEYKRKAQRQRALETCTAVGNRKLARTNGSR